MQIEQCTTFIHADDFGITPGQAKDILSLSSSCGGDGALNSVSIFANSPAFHEAASLAQPHANRGVLRVCLHLNLVEGPSIADPKRISLLVNERGMFDNDFVGLLQAGYHQQMRGIQPASYRMPLSDTTFFISVP